MYQPVLMPVHSSAAAALAPLARPGPAVLEAPDRIWERLGPLFCK